MKKGNQIKALLNKIGTEKIENIKKEIQQKESWVVNTAEQSDLFDATHAEMVLDFIRDNKKPSRPETINKLMIQFISSAFSYNRIRKQLRKINRIQFNEDNYPVREDHQKILAYLLNDERFEDESNWRPERFGVLVEEIDEKGEYKELQIMSPYWLEHIMNILRTAPAKMIRLTNQNVEEFYNKIDGICNSDYDNDIFRKSALLWELATELSIGITNVGTNLMCDFLKESGFTDYAKMDIHLIRSMSEVLEVYRCSNLSDFESFVVSQWLADKIKITPFKLDKILYVCGVYNK